MAAKPDAEVAAENAALATAHAESAADAAAQAERELAEATKEDPDAKLCPDDNVEMTRHDRDHPHHPNFWHCPVCGKCQSAREWNRTSG